MLENAAKDILWEAIEAPPEDRARLLAERCGDDAALLERVQRLLAAHEDSDRLFGKRGSTVGASALPKGPARSPDLEQGDRLGPYRVIRVAGTGGFGTVYLAEQTEPVARRVALKVLHTGLGSAAARARFDAERQALALMAHPAIASVFDAGTTESGQPWFAMEFIPGEPITDYCRSHQLGLHETLHLFREVCLAIHHAHQKGVVHRDLKPSNVIVIEVDGRPRPKVIDFGIAKALDRPLTEDAISLDGQFVGTPAYMSPEQAAMKGDVDTRSDVYSLGVLLYELLSGEPPFDVDTLSFTELIRAIAVSDPPLPSRRLRTSRRKTSIRTLPPDLDWVVMRCLEKDRTRRYPSANRLAEDTGRFLAGLPVEAAPPSLAYRVRKLALRHSLAVASIGAVLIALVVGAVGTGVGLVRANRANERLTEALAELQVEAERARDAEQLAELAAQEAVEQSETAEAINRFLRHDLLGAARPSDRAGEGRNVTLREVLDIAALELDVHDSREGRFADKPVIEGAIRATLGAVYTELGEVDSAIRHFRRALQLRVETLGPDHPDTLGTQRNLADQLARVGRLDEAEELLVPVVEEQREVLGDLDLATLVSRRDLGMLRYRQGRSDEAYAILKDALADSEEAMSPLGDTSLNIIGALAIAAHGSGRLDEAEELFRESHARRTEAHGESNPDTINARVNLAAFLQSIDRNDEAREELLAGLVQQRAVFGPKHTATGTTLFNLGAIAVDEGRIEEGLELLEESLAIESEALGEAHPRTLIVVSKIGRAYAALGDRTEAERYYRRAYELSVAEVGELHPTTDSRRKDLAGFLFHDPAAREEVTQLLELSYESQVETQGPIHPSTLRSLMNLAMLHGDEGRHAEAEEMLENVVAGFREALGPDHVETLAAESTLAGTYLSQERWADAAELARRTVEVGKHTLHPESVDLARFKLRYGLAMAELGEQDDAVSLTREAYAVLRKTLGEHHNQTSFARRALQTWGVPLD